MYSRKRPGHRFRAEFFTSARELVKWAEEKEPPDLVLLDIYMPEKTGMAAARELPILSIRSMWTV